MPAAVTGYNADQRNRINRAIYAVGTFRYSRAAAQG